MIITQIGIGVHSLSLSMMPWYLKKSVTWESGGKQVSVTYRSADVEYYSTSTALYKAAEPTISEDCIEFTQDYN